MMYTTIFYMITYTCGVLWFFYPGYKLAIYHIHQGVNQAKVECVEVEGTV